MSQGRVTIEESQAITTEDKISKLRTIIFNTVETSDLKEAQIKEENFRRLHSNPKFKSLITLMDNDKTFNETLKNTMNSYNNTYDSPKGVFNRPSLYSSDWFRKQNVTKPANIDLAERISMMKSTASPKYPKIDWYVGTSSLKKGFEYNYNYRLNLYDKNIKLSAKDDFKETLNRFYKINTKSPPLNYYPNMIRVSRSGNDVLAQGIKKKELFVPKRSIFNKLNKLENCSLQTKCPKKITTLSFEGFDDNKVPFAMKNEKYFAPEKFRNHIKL
jgi:hypothetical protein